MDSIDYSKWADALYQQGRNHILLDARSFELAGKKLAETFSAEFAKNPLRIEPAGDCLGHSQSREQLLLLRISYARTAALKPMGLPEFCSLSIMPSEKSSVREHTARQVILALLLAADPDANDYITPEICELAQLEFETNDPKVFGRRWVCWNWDSKDRHLCHGDEHHNLPTPQALKQLEHALGFVSNLEKLSKAASSESLEGVPPQQSIHPPKKVGWTKQQLYESAGISPSTFDKIRTDSGIRPSKRGGGGQTRQYDTEDLQMLCKTVRGGRYQRKSGILNAWQGCTALLKSP